MSERLERVTAFSELATGMKVVVTPCGWCAPPSTPRINPMSDPARAVSCEYLGCKPSDPRIGGHWDGCDRLTSAVEAALSVERREVLRYVAAYLLDRGDQQDTDGGKWVPLADAAHAIAEGEFEAAWKHGEIDEGDVLERVDRWFARRTP